VTITPLTRYQTPVALNPLYTLIQNEGLPDSINTKGIDETFRLSLMTSLSLPAALMRRASSSVSLMWKHSSVFE
jgi:hypothetical protein